MRRTYNSCLEGVMQDHEMSDKAQRAFAVGFEIGEQGAEDGVFLTECLEKASAMAVLIFGSTNEATFFCRRGCISGFNNALKDEG